jgi:hypothetical protein
VAAAVVRSRAPATLRPPPKKIMSAARCAPSFHLVQPADNGDGIDLAVTRTDLTRSHNVGFGYVRGLSVGRDTSSRRPGEAIGTPSSLQSALWSSAPAMA